MGYPPAHHIRRPRLADAAAAERVVVVEAGAGYGKTTFAGELVDAWRAVEIEVSLDEGGVSAALFAARLRAAVARAGFSDAAAAMSASGDDPHGAVDAAVAALAEERCAFVVDDAHHAAREAATLIERLARQIRAPQQLAVLARRLPEGCERLRRGEYLQFQPADLALRPDETLELCRRGFGLEVTAADAEALHAATGGWTAATVLAAARAKRTGESLQAVAAAAGTGRGRGESAVAAILEEAVVALGAEDLAVLAQVARLPHIDAASVDLVGGTAGFLDKALAVGVPFAPVGGEGRFDLPGPVRDLLAARSPADHAALSRVAEGYAKRGELGAALQLLFAIGERSAAAALLAAAAPAFLDAVDLLEYQSFVDGLDSASLDAHPQVLLHLARLYDGASLFDKRSEVLDRLDALSSANEGALRDSLHIERTADLMRSSHYAEVEARAGRFLEADGGADAVTRARALSLLARSVCMRTDHLGRRDEAAMRRSEGHFDQAAELYRSVGLPGSAAAMVPYQAMWIDYSLGNARSALARLDEGLGTVVHRPRRWGFLQSFRAEVLTELGRYGDAADACRQVSDLGDRYDDDQLRAYAYWGEAIVASHLGDAERVLERLRLVERHPGEWFEPTSGDFLGDAADSLDRVGQTALAWEYLERAMLDPKDGTAMIAMAEVALLARHGDPQRATERLETVFSRRVDPRERWRVTLLRAHAAFRLGERGAGALAARAFEEAARMGLDQLPLTKERDVTLALLGLAAETGQPAALALQQASLPVAITVLGRFALTRGGRPVALSPGQGVQLLKLLAVSGGRMPTERVIDTLWPEAQRDAGRHRLRTVLNRLRSEAGEVVVREGDVLALDGDLHVDLDELEQEARRARALGSVEPTLAVAVARSAIARYRGDLLPDDLYEPWAERARDHARRTALELVDLCTDAATERGDLDEVRRLVELAIDLAPYEDDRYLRAAASLLEQGRRGAALAVVSRARAALAELGLPPPLELVHIERSVVA